MAEAERIYAEDLADPADVDADIGLMQTDFFGKPFTQRGLHAKLAILRATFGFIGKTGTNTGVGGGYGFVEATDVARRFVERASELNLTMLPIYMQVVDTRPSASGKQMVYSLNSICVSPTRTLVSSSMSTPSGRAQIRPTRRSRKRRRTP